MCYDIIIYRQPIECGQTIRLTHVSTNRNLHSHHFQSPLSHNLEVSAYGDNGEGDEGKYFYILKMILPLKRSYEKI